MTDGDVAVFSAVLYPFTGVVVSTFSASMMISEQPSAPPVTLNVYEVPSPDCTTLYHRPVPTTVLGSETVSFTLYTCVHPAGAEPFLSPPNNDHEKNANITLPTVGVVPSVTVFDVAALLSGDAIVWTIDISPPHGVPELGVTVCVGVGVVAEVWLGVTVGVAVFVLVGVTVGVTVSVGVIVGVAVGVFVGVGVGVGSIVSDSVAICPAVNARVAIPSPPTVIFPMSVESEVAVAHETKYVPGGRLPTVYVPEESQCNTTA